MAVAGVAAPLVAAMNDHRIIHAPEYQRGMHKATARPGCYRTIDDGVACACCTTPEQQQTLLEHTPGCELCARGQRSAWLYWKYCQ
jgi:hypothetical protein